MHFIPLFAATPLPCDDRGEDCDQLIDFIHVPRQLDRLGLSGRND